MANLAPALAQVCQFIVPCQLETSTPRIMAAPYRTSGGGIVLVGVGCDVEGATTGAAAPRSSIEAMSTGSPEKRYPEQFEMEVALNTVA